MHSLTLRLVWCIQKLFYDLCQIFFLTSSTSRQTSQLSITARTNNSIIVYKYLTKITSFLSCRVSTNFCWFEGFVFFTFTYAKRHQRIFELLKDKIFDCTALIFTIFINKIKIIPLILIFLY